MIGTWKSRRLTPVRILVPLLAVHLVLAAPIFAQTRLPPPIRIDVAEIAPRLRSHEATSTTGTRVQLATSTDTPQEELPAVHSQLALHMLEDMALANNPTLARAQARIEAARGQWVQFGLLPNPTFGYSGQQIGSRGQAEQDGVILGQELVRGGKRRLSQAVAEREIAKLEQDYSAHELRVRTDVRMAFYEVLVAQQRLELHSELVKLGNQGVQAAEDMFRSKLVSRVDVLQARLETEQTKYQKQNANHRFDSAWRTLAAVVGDEQLTAQPLTGDLTRNYPRFQWEPAMQRLLAMSPEIAGAVAEVDRTHWALERARAEAIPNVSVQGIVQHDNQIRGTDGAIQITMPFPVFNRNQGGIRQAEAEIVVAERNLRRVELDLQQRLAQVFERYLNAQNQVDGYTREILPNANESLELTRDGYRAGEFGFLNLLTAQRTYFQTRLAYLDALRDLWSAAWEIEGLLLSKSLNSENQ